MRPRRIPRDTSTLRTALPRFFPGGKDGALVIHGFTGTPRELEELGGRLARAGLTVSIPRLPGHATNGRDFLQTGWRDWLRASIDAYADMRASCDRIHVVGFSMGGLLAVILASLFPVERLALLAPAMRLRNPLLPLAPLLRIFIDRIRWPVSGTPEITDEDYAVLAREYWGWRFSSQSASLLRLQRMARRALRRVTSDTLIVLGGDDRAVPRSVIPLIEGRIASRRKRHLCVEGSAHLLLAGEHGERVREEIVHWLLD